MLEGRPDCFEVLKRDDLPAGTFEKMELGSSLEPKFLNDNYLAPTGRSYDHITCVRSRDWPLLRCWKRDWSCKCLQKNAQTLSGLPPLRYIIWRWQIRARFLCCPEDVHFLTGGPGSCAGRPASSASNRASSASRLDMQAGGC